MHCLLSCCATTHSSLIGMPPQQPMQEHNDALLAILLATVTKGTAACNAIVEKVGGGWVRRCAEWVGGWVGPCEVA